MGGAAGLSEGSHSLFLVLDSTRCVDTSLCKRLIGDRSTQLYNWDSSDFLLTIKSIWLRVSSSISSFEIRHYDKILNGTLLLPRTFAATLPHTYGASDL
jgi:hypothetical protein